MTDIGLEEGSGGEEMMKLLEESVLPHLEGGDLEIGLEEMDDGAAWELPDGNYLVFTTDTHVVKPLFFPGGDIGKLAVSGTVNDLAVMGADPKYLSSAIVVEEGFEREEVEEISRSMGETADEADVNIVTGDLKVVERGGLDGITVNTSGVGVAERLTKSSSLEPGDSIVVSGDVGRHGMAVLASRHGLDFSIESDVNPVNGLVQKLMEVDGVKSLKDPTRGGLAAALNEMADCSGVGVKVSEDKIPLDSEVEGAGKVLGIDPYGLANEGRVVVGVESPFVDDVMDVLRKSSLAPGAEVIGMCKEKNPGKVLLETEIGTKRVLRPPHGDPLPRIC